MNLLKTLNILKMEGIKMTSQMTAKHFKDIAKIIRKPVQEIDNEFSYENQELPRVILIQLACDLADYFKGENPRFDKDKFMKACGIE